MRRFAICRLLLLTATAVLMFGVSGAQAADQPSPEAIRFFERRIRPVLVEHCYQCHSHRVAAPKGGLRLDWRGGLLQGGDSGPAIVPGDPEESLLMQALRYESLEMPPKGKLPDHILADFEKWIRMGAPDPRTADPAANVAQPPAPQPGDHWAFQPIRRVALPPIRDVAWPIQDIDAFIARRLKEAGLDPAGDAPPEVLVRRLCFDLIGLPPTADELHQFVADRRPDAYERLVDRLLASPHFGERWGRHWLDIVRFAESSGGGRTRIFDQAWRFRDYVIDVVNRDQPIDRTIRQHIAGDLLPADSWQERAENLIATGFLVLGPINYELQDKELLRMEVIDEQLETIGRAFLGMTLGCARCHDHKFDPIPTRDYYAMAGFFWSTKSLVPGNVSGFVQRELPLAPQQRARWAEHQAARKKLEEKLARLDAELQQLDEQQKQLRQQLDGPVVVVDDAQAELEGSWSTSRSIKPFFGKHYRHSGPGPSRAVFAATLPASGRYRVAVAYTAHPNRASNVRVQVHHAAGTETLTINQRRQPSPDAPFRDVGVFSFEAAEPASVAINCADADGVVVVDAVRWIAVDRGEAIAAEEREKLLRQQQALGEQQARLQRERAEVASQLKLLERQAPEQPPLVMAVLDQPQEGDCPLCVRGDVHRQGPRVPRGFLTALRTVPVPSIPEDQSGRLQLADWIVAPENPLTWRVMANRVWLKTMGEGIVRTPDNFGTAGRRPTHPQLLDYLAGLLRDGRSTKQLVRQIVLSRAYRMSSQPGESARATDPENRLWSRAKRRRLDAEELRDAMLVFSGELDRRMGGPTIPQGTSSEFGFSFDSLRRSIYVPVFRNNTYDLLAAFDIANPNLVQGQRNVSVLPGQALVLMNSPFVLQRAEAAARRLLALPASDDAARLDAAFLLALGRHPSGAERDAAMRFLAAAHTSEKERLDRWVQICQILIACIDFRYAD